MRLGFDKVVAPKSAPTALMHSLKHYKVLHEKNVIISVETTHTPRVESTKRVEIEQVGSTFMRIRLRFGYMESPNIPRALAIARKLGWQFDVVLLVAPRAQAGAAFGHAALAGPPVHLAGAFRQRRYRLFPDSDRPGGRSRHTGDCLGVNS